MINKKAMTDNIIVLCHIIENYKEFETKLLPMLSSKYSVDFISQLRSISKGKNIFGASKTKKFYQENKSIIDTINQYSNITDFILDNYNWSGKPNTNIQFFYQYISNHKKDINQILATLEALNKLGFGYFEFNEDINFTTETYKAYPLFKNNYSIVYVANLEIIPSYENNINYKTSHSNYKIELDIIGEDISKYSRKILLNSLLFDLKTLPESINKKTTFDYILQLKEAKKEEQAIIINAVDLSISVSDLENQLNSTNNTIIKLDKVKSKKEIINILLNIRENIEKLKTLSIEHDNDVSLQNPLLTPEILTKEKYLYLERRYWSNIDID